MLGVKFVNILLPVRLNHFEKPDQAGAQTRWQGVDFGIHLRKRFHKPLHKRYIPFAL